MGAGRCLLGTGTLTHTGAAFSGPHTRLFHGASPCSRVLHSAGPSWSWAHDCRGRQAEALPCWWENQGSPSRRKIRATVALRLSQEPEAGRALERVLVAWARDGGGEPAETPASCSR